MTKVIGDSVAKGVLMVDDHLRRAVDPVHPGVIADRQFGVKRIPLCLKRIHYFVFANFFGGGFQCFHGLIPAKRRVALITIDFN